MKITENKFNELKTQLAMWIHADEQLMDPSGTTFRKGLTGSDILNAEENVKARLSSECVFTAKVAKVTQVVISTLDIKVMKPDHNCNWCQDKGTYIKAVPGTHGREREQIDCTHCK